MFMALRVPSVQTASAALLFHVPAVEAATTEQRGALKARFLRNFLLFEKAVEVLSR